MKTAADLVALTRQKTWDKDVVLWVGAEKTLLHILAQLAYVVLDLLDLFDEERLPMDDEETRVRLLRGLCHELQSFQVGPERRTVLVVKSIGLLARYHAGVREFYEWFCGDFAIVVLILDGLVDERVWPEEVACNANRLLKYFPEQRDADVWDAVRDAEIKSEYAAALAKVKMFPVAFSLRAARDG